MSYSTTLIKLFTRYKGKNIQAVRLEKLSPMLQELFWLETAEDICRLIISEINQARQALRQVKVIKNKDLLEESILSVERSAQKVLTERREVINFLTKYEEQISPNL